MIITKCDNCGIEVEKRNGDMQYKSHFCSNACRLEYYKSENKFILNCVNCGKEIERYSCQIKVGHNSYCSRRCRFDYEDTSSIEKCSICGQGIRIPKWRQGQNNYFCSQECKGKYWSNNFVGENATNWQGGKLKKVCPVCNTEFEIFKVYEKEINFCSPKCFGIWKSDNLAGENSPYYNRIDCTCDYCGKEMKLQPCFINENEHNFCSRECCGNFKSEFYSGENAHAWQGGKSKQNRLLRTNRNYLNWRDACLTRDDNRCQKCGKVEDGLHVHHIEEFSELLTNNNIKTSEQARQCEELYDVNNGITFCKNCHIAFHKKYGTKNNNQSQLEAFLC